MEKKNENFDENENKNDANDNENSFELIPTTKLLITKNLNNLRKNPDENIIIIPPKNENKNIFMNKPNLFVFHGYPNLIYEIIYNRKTNMKVIGYIENGSITTPFDMRVRNKIDRFNICIYISNMIKNVDTKNLVDYCCSMLKKHKKYIKQHGKDMNIIKY